ncbi:MAG TPA: PA2169 family four-helix-bundle protein [Caulobacter sp.]|nr:PA2169 family four-helix-bundle protein [Caulobacter sp.]
MHSSNDHAVKVLNSLIETTLDSANGYKEAAENVEAPQYRTMFSERATKRMELTRRLQQEVRSFGGDPEDDQSLLGKAHNKFVDIKNALTGGPNDKSVIDEVERGEDVIKAKYEAATRDEDLPMQVKSVITEAYQSVKQDHDEISRIKHSMH